MRFVVQDMCKKMVRYGQLAAVESNRNFQEKYPAACIACQQKFPVDLANTNVL